MQRRLAITYAATATATLGIACIAIAAVGGGLFASAASPLSAGGKQVEIVDEFIVVHSSTTVATEVAPLDTVVAPASSAGTAKASPHAVAVVPQPEVAPTPAAPQPAPPAPSAIPAEVASPMPGASPAPAPGLDAAPAETSAATTAPTTATPTTAAPTTVAPSPTTTAPAVVAALPPGVRIPRDWPAGKPIPPIPAGCEKPRLRDNGVWDCDD